ncbi:MAG: fibronectin type III domain-containing protein [Firmicutes bacterium]|nr:fibronectin type III domain-containing protein [Bacillota bacterium]
MFAKVKKSIALVLALAVAFTFMPVASDVVYAATDNSKTYLELYTDENATKTTTEFVYNSCTAKADGTTYATTPVYIKANCVATGENDPWIGIYRGSFDEKVWAAKTGEASSLIWAYAEKTDGKQTKAYNGSKAVNMMDGGGYQNWGFGSWTLGLGDYTVILFKDVNSYEPVAFKQFSVVKGSASIPTVTLLSDEHAATPLTREHLPGVEIYDFYTLGKGMKVKVDIPAGYKNEGMWLAVYSGTNSGANSTVYEDGYFAYCYVNESKTFDFLEECKVTDGAETYLKQVAPLKFVLFANEDFKELYELSTTFFFLREDGSDSKLELKSTELTYTGQAQVPAGGNDTYSDRHFTIELAPGTNGTDVGTHKAYAKFHGEVGGQTAAVSYKIVEKNIGDKDVTVEIADVKDTGSAVTANPVIKFNGMTLEEGKDFTINYANNVKAGKASATIVGKGNYTGTRAASFNIVHTWKDATCSAPKTCTGCKETEGAALAHTFIAATCTTPKTCSVCTATEGAALGHSWTAATCTAAKACSRCTATEGAALGHNWTAATCTAAKACSRCTATEGAALGHSWAAATCTTPKTCSTCTATEGIALGHAWAAATCTTPMTCSTCAATEGAALDHAWTEATCVTPKTCTVCTATEGEALGHAVATTTVEKATATKDGAKTEICACGEVLSETAIKAAKVSLSKAGVNFTGKKVKAPTVIVKDGKGKKIPAKYYTVVQPKNVKQMKDIGRYTYTIKFEATCPEYMGTVKVNFEIKPLKTTIKAPAAAKKAITVKWKAVPKAKKAQVTGYEVQIATNKAFTKGVKKVNVKGFAKTSAKVKGLKSKTKYFVKVRTYKTVKGVKIYSDWSKVKNCKAK